MSQRDDEIAKKYGVAAVPAPAPKQARDAEIASKYGVSTDQVDRQSRADYLAGVKNELSPSSVLSTIGKTYDTYSGAPVRAAADTLLDGKGLAETVRSFKNQWGENPALAPTGKEIAKKVGFSDKADPITGISAADGMGVVADIGLDLSNVVPVGAAVKGAYTASKMIGKGATLGAGKIIGGSADNIANAMVHSGGAVEDTVKGFLKGLNPKKAEDLNVALDIANRHGIPADALSDAIVYGDKSLISTLSRKRAQGPSGEALATKHEYGLKQIQEATDRFVVNTIGQGQKPLNPQEAGNLLQETWTSKVDEFFRNRDVTYASALDDIPDSGITQKARENLLENLNEIANEVGEVYQPGVDPALKKQADLTIERLNWIADMANEGTYKELVAALKTVGKDAFGYRKAGLAESIPADVKVNRKLYGQLQDAIYDTVEVVAGPETVGRLKENNKALTKFFQENALIEKTLLDKKSAPEDIYRSLIESGDSKQLQAIKSILGENSPVLSQLKASYVENLKRTNKDEAFSFANLGNKLRNNRQAQTVVQNLFNPEEVQGLGELVMLGEHHGPSILNPSASGQFLNLSDFGKAVSSDAKESGMIGYLKRKAEKNSPRGGSPAAAKQAVGGGRFSFNPSQEKQSFTIPERLADMISNATAGSVVRGGLNAARRTTLRQIPKETSIQKYNEVDAMKRRMRGK